ncbi:MAG TPA: maleylpyruvate isomerase N-terminal domain-containing protein [Acidimicrobiales bacterium]|nr:maleylpyruvate isomerase N-terminal domain-containing protein [Acidimicrobiales bacterium]
MDDVLEQVERATAAVGDALARTDLDAPSELPGWSRLTVACHLRFGAETLLRMTDDALAGRPASYYPGGRHRQRPGTLVSRPGETPAAVVESLLQASAALHHRWRAVTDWSLEVREPADNPDLGTVPLRRLLLSRLTEVEVHGTDLGVGLGPWSDVLVRHALPMRLEWLDARRSNHRAVDESMRRRWLLVATDVPVRQLVEVDGPLLRSTPVAADATPEVDDTVTGTGAELLALLLGRAPAPFAPADFNRALPGP